MLRATFYRDDKAILENVEVSIEDLAPPGARPDREGTMVLTPDEATPISCGDKLRMALSDGSKMFVVVTKCKGGYGSTTITFCPTPEPE
jgi:hypothetical protein